MVMSSPAWLYYLFGLLMLVVAAYCLVLLSLSLTTGRRGGRDVELSHVLMGTAMAGMFVPSWAFGPRGLWTVAFGALTVWFVVESIQSVHRWGLHLPHALIHALMGVAMLLMFWFPVGATAGAMSMAAHGARVDPGLSFLVAFALLASAVFTLASPNKGASHFGSHAPAYAVAYAAAGTAGTAGTAGAPPDARPPAAPSPVAAAEQVLTTGWLVDLSHVVMCLAMGFMLILMI